MIIIMIITVTAEYLDATRTHLHAASHNNHTQWTKSLQRVVMTRERTHWDSEPTTNDDDNDSQYSLPTSVSLWDSWGLFMFFSSPHHRCSMHSYTIAQTIAMLAVSCCFSFYLVIQLCHRSRFVVFLTSFVFIRNLVCLNIFLNAEEEKKEKNLKNSASYHRVYQHTMAIRPEQIEAIQMRFC